MTTRTSTTLLIPILIFAALLLSLRHGFTDDGYIHIQYANNMITYGEYSFNVGEVSYGTTSPLWVMLLAAVGSVFGGGENLVLYSRLLSWLSGAGAVILMFVFARTLGLGRLVAWLGALVMAVHAWHVRWAALSMETSSAVLLIAAVGVASVNAPSSMRKAGLLGLFMALATLMRPEAYLMAPAYLMAFLVVRRRQWSSLATTFVVYAALVVPWMVFAKFHLGQLLPNTAGAKSGGLTLNPLVLLEKLGPVFRIVGSTEGVLLLAVLVSIVVLRSRARVLSHNCRFLLLWVIALPAAYVLFDIQILSRYLLLTTPFALVLGFVALTELAIKIVCLFLFHLRSPSLQLSPLEASRFVPGDCYRPLAVRV